jgi:hypothetical protein
MAFKTKIIIILRVVLPVLHNCPDVHYIASTKVSSKIMRFWMFPKTFESVMQWSEGGRLFQARGPAYEKARLPISVRQRGLMYWAVLADRRPDLVWLTATARVMSAEYVGHWPVWIECIMVHNLKSTQRVTGNHGVELLQSCRCHVFVHPFIRLSEDLLYIPLSYILK